MTILSSTRSFFVDVILDIDKDKIQDKMVDEKRPSLVATDCVLDQYTDPTKTWPTGTICEK